MINDVRKAEAQIRKILQDLNLRYPKLRIEGLNLYLLDNVEVVIGVNNGSFARKQMDSHTLTIGGDNSNPKGS